MASKSLETHSMEIRIEQPWEYHRIGVLIRIVLIFGVLSPITFIAIGISLCVGLILTISIIYRVGGSQFHARYHATYSKAIQFSLDASAYFLVATDAFPQWGKPGSNKVKIGPTGTPTFQSSLLRIFTIIPHITTTIILFVIAVTLIPAALIFILIDASVPAFLWRFQSGVATRLMQDLVYLYSIVDKYPQFALEIPKPSRKRL